MRKEIYTTYAPAADMTFIMEDTFNADNECTGTECVGWYYGEPTDDNTEYYKGKLKAEYL
jgi:hypothetical protein